MALARRAVVRAGEVESSPSHADHAMGVEEAEHTNTARVARAVGKKHWVLAMLVKGLGTVYVLGVMPIPRSEAQDLIVTAAPPRPRMLPSRQRHSDVRRPQEEALNVAP